MSSLDRLASERTDLTPTEVEHLQGLVGAWALVADLAMSDLVLWLPTWNSGGWVAAALVRPTTASTSVPEDVVGSFLPRGRQPALDRAAASLQMVPSAEGAVAVPIHVGARVIAVLAREASTWRTGQIEDVYRGLAEQLLTCRLGFGQCPSPRGRWTHHR